MPHASACKQTMQCHATRVKNECHNAVITTMQNDLLTIITMSSKITPQISRLNEMHWFSRHILYSLPPLLP